MSDNMQHVASPSLTNIYTLYTPSSQFWYVLFENPNKKYKKIKSRAFHEYPKAWEVKQI